MADDALLRLFLNDWHGWVKWRLENRGADVDFQGADFKGLQLPAAFLTGCNVGRADFSGALLESARFEAATCYGTIFDGANLTKASFLGANLERASLKGAHLEHAVLADTTLYGTVFADAILTDAQLEKARMVGTDFTRARLVGARVYGVSVWDVVLEGTEQNDLVISQDWGSSIVEPPAALVTDNLELAQFLYLILNNAKLRRVIDTLTAKVVLILGRFSPESIAMLHVLKADLRRRGYVPVLFTFPKPDSRDLTETVSLIAHMSRFIVADISAPRSVPHELASLVPRLLSVPVQPLLANGEKPYAMFADIQRYPQVLPVKRYSDKLDSDVLDAVVTATATRSAQ
jgi:uncharacterized protein YjbI with pentapeptide repeats